jgi:hypothetical protein
VFVLQAESQSSTMIEYFDQNDSKEVLKVKEKEKVKNWRLLNFWLKKKTQRQHDMTCIFETPPHQIRV